MTELLANIEAEAYKDEDRPQDSPGLPDRPGDHPDGPVRDFPSGVNSNRLGMSMGISASSISKP